MCGERPEFNTPLASEVSTRKMTRIQSNDQLFGDLSPQELTASGFFGGLDVTSQILKNTTE